MDAAQARRESRLGLNRYSGSSRPGMLSLGWGGSVRSVAAGLGVELERVYEVHERLPLAEDVENGMGLFKAGTAPTPSPIGPWQPEQLST